MNTKKKVLLQILGWIIWFASQSISYLSELEHFPILPAAYNYLSLVVVFYLTFFCTSSLCKSFSVYKAASMRGFKMVFYILWRPPTFFIVLIPFIYAIGSWFYDGLMVKLGYLPYRFPDFLRYIEGRWAREDIYFCMAILIATFTFMYRRRDGIIRSQRAQNKLLLDHLTRNDQFLNDLDNEVKRYLNDQNENF